MERSVNYIYSVMEKIQEDKVYNFLEEIFVWHLFLSFGLLFIQITMVQLKENQLVDMECSVNVIYSEM